MRPEDFLPAKIVGDKPERMMTTPQRVKRDKTPKAEPGRMYAHQEKDVKGYSISPGSFDASASPFR